MNTKETKAIFIGPAAPLDGNAPTLPLYLSPVKAGFPSPADDYVEDKLNLHTHLVRNEAATFFLHASGRLAKQVCSDSRFNLTSP